MNNVKRIAMNIVNQVLDDVGASVEFRQAHNDEYDEFVSKLIIEAIKESGKPMVKGIKCIVRGCRNYKHEGTFIGDLCGPCYDYLVSGRIGPTSSFLADIESLAHRKGRLEAFEESKEMATLGKEELQLVQVYIAAMIDQKMSYEQEAIDAWQRQVSTGRIG